MALTDFDRFFMNLPPLDRQNDFTSFWEKSISAVKKIPLEASVQKGRKSGSGPFSLFDVTFKSFMKTQITGVLLKPKNGKKPPVILMAHDYNRKPRINPSKLDDSFAYFFITMRGHSILTEEENAEEKSPGYLIENILDRETYYVKAVYLDLLRSIDMLRLISDIDCSRIGVIGKGLGAAAALFAAVNSDRVVALVMETPSFSHLELSQNISQGDAAREINDYISENKSQKKKIKGNLTYFDILNFSDMVTCPALTTVGLKDTLSPPECVFGLFNHLLCEKTMEVYPEQGNTAGGENQLVKSIAWIRERLEIK